MPPALPLKGIAILEIKTASAAGEMKADGKDSGKDHGKSGSKKKPDLQYMPSGSFLKAVLMSGMDAPTGSKARGQPHPVLLRIVDPAFLPNEFRYDIMGCFIVGEGYGELAAERAYVRTVSVSCIKKDGKSYMDAPMKGFVAGEDGKIGLRGKVVSKNGAILARAILAGFLQGVGQAFSQAQSTVQFTPVGTTQTTIDTSKTLQYGAYGGVSKSMDILAKYYLDLANEIFPIIEVDAGRKVHVVMTSGQDIKFKEVNQEKQ